AIGIAAGEAIPDRLRHADATFHRARIRTWRLAPGPADFFRADSSLHPAGFAFVVDFAEGQRVHPAFFGQLVDRLLESEYGLRRPGGAERGGWAGVDEDVVVLGADVVALVHALRRAARARAGADAAGAVVHQLNRDELSVLLRADLVLGVGAGPIAD